LPSIDKQWFNNLCGASPEWCAGQPRAVHRPLRVDVAVVGRPGRPAQRAGFLHSVYAGLGDAETAANHLGQLGVDIGDRQLRSLLGEHYAAVETELRRLVRAAAAELPGAPGSARAARTLLAVINAVSIDWSIRPKGCLVDRLEQDVDAVLVGWHRERK
jgi:hypothetical protein